MNLPSVKTLERAFPGKGRVLRKLLESPAAVRAYPAAVARGGAPQYVNSATPGRADPRH